MDINVKCWTELRNTRNEACPFFFVSRACTCATALRSKIEKAKRKKKLKRVWKVTERGKPCRTPACTLSIYYWHRKLGASRIARIASFIPTLRDISEGLLFFSSVSAILFCFRSPSHAVHRIVFRFELFLSNWGGRNSRKEGQDPSISKRKKKRRAAEREGECDKQTKRERDGKRG